MSSKIEVIDFCLPKFSPPKFVFASFLHIYFQINKHVATPYCPSDSAVSWTPCSTWYSVALNIIFTAKLTFFSNITNSYVKLTSRRQKNNNSLIMPWNINNIFTHQIMQMQIFACFQTFAKFFLFVNRETK